MEKLTWFFELLDKVSAPAKRMSTALSKVDSAFAALKTKGASGLDALGGKLKGFALGAGGMALDVAKGAAGLALGIGAAGIGLGIVGAKWALDALAFKENSDVAFQTILGSKTAADRVMKNAIKFAAVTPFETKDTIANYQRLLVAGFKENELNTVMAGAGDLGAAFGPEKTDQAIGAFQKIMAQGKLTGESIQMLGDAGINVGKVYEQLGKSFGTTAKGAQAMISAGTIDSRSGIVASLNVIRETISGGDLGGMMEKQSQTLSGLWSSLTSKPFELLIEADASGAMAGLKSLMRIVSDALDPASPTGKRAIAFMSDISDRAGKLFSSITAADVERVMNRAITIFESVKNAVSEMASGFALNFSGIPASLGATEAALGSVDKAVGSNKVNWKEFGRALGDIANALIAIVDAATKVGNMFANDGPVNRSIFKFVDGVANDEAKADAAARAEAVGRASGQGLVNGLNAQQLAVQGAGAALGESAKAGTATALQIHSPSRAYFDFGVLSGEGFDLGLDKSGANDPLRPPTFEPGAAPTTGGGVASSFGPFSISITVQAHGKNDAGELGESVADALEERLVSIFDRYALQTGT